MMVELIWASCRCHSLDSEIVRDFQVDLVFAVVGAVGGEHSLILFRPFSVVDERSVVVWTIIYMPLI